MRSFEAVGATLGAENVERNQAADDVRREEWAALLCASIRREVHELPKLGLAGDAAESTPTASPTGADAALTPAGDNLDANQQVDVAGDCATEEGQETTRLHFDIEAGSLGKVSLSVQRAAGAIEVTIGLDDPRQQVLIDLERTALITALKAAGLNVASVVITSRAAAGTALALTKRGTIAHQQAIASSAYRGRPARQLTETEEGVDLVG